MNPRHVNAKAEPYSHCSSNSCTDVVTSRSDLELTL
jgi:hypothetical protein